jgi:hypothetical protein
MFGVGDRVTDNLSSFGISKQVLSTKRSPTHVFEEDLEDTTGLFVDETRDTLHTTTTSEAANGGLCDTLDVVTKDLAMTLSTTLAKSLHKAQDHPSSDPSHLKLGKLNLPFHLFHGQTYSKS